MCYEYRGVLDYLPRYVGEAAGGEDHLYAELSVLEKELDHYTQKLEKLRLERSKTINKKVAEYLGSLSITLIAKQNGEAVRVALRGSFTASRALYLTLSRRSTNLCLAL